MNKRMIGSVYEDEAVSYLEKNGFQILERNFRCKVGEADIIAMKDGILRFIEVKYRKNEGFGNAVEAVDSRKLHKLYRVAEFYLKRHQEYQNTGSSFDIVAITGNQVRYYFNCYGAM